MQQVFFIDQLNTNKNPQELARAKFANITILQTSRLIVGQRIISTNSLNIVLVPFPFYILFFTYFLVPKCFFYLLLLIQIFKNSLNVVSHTIVLLNFFLNDFQKSIFSLPMGECMSKLLIKG